jgi:exosortase/archaeosortase family protein
LEKYQHWQIKNNYQIQEQFGTKKDLHIWNAMILLSKRYFMLALPLMAFWPVVKWHFLRASESPEELSGSFAILLAIIFVACQRMRKDADFTDRSFYAHAIMLILCYALSYHFVPPMIRAAFALTALTRIVSSLFLKKKFHMGLWILLGLSLPVIPTLQFYLGYPLRAAVAQLALPLIRMAGFAVTREGACFHFAGQSIWIDAPCSGIQMLWAGLLLAAAGSCFKNLDSFRTAFALSVACIMAVFANAIRAAALFFIEAHIMKAPAWFHEGVGVIAFLMLGLSILWVVHRTRSRRLPACT